jgi:hypothetical protein
MARAAGALLALALGLFFAPAEVRAGCGAGHVGLAHPAATDKKPVQPAAPKPCSGPHCTRGPLAPPVVPITAPTVTAEDSALPVAAPQTVTPPSACRRDHDLSGQPVRNPSAIFHPPR